MSLILEALKKSEAERQLGRAPGLMSPTVRVSKRRGVSPWWGILGLAVLIVGGGAWYVNRAPAVVVARDDAPAAVAARDDVAAATREAQAAPAPVEARPAAPTADTTAPTLVATTPVADTAPVAASQPAPTSRDVVNAPPRPDAVPMPLDPEFESVERESIPMQTPVSQPLPAPPTLPATIPPMGDTTPPPIQTAPIEPAPTETAPTEPPLEALPTLDQLLPDVRSALPALKLSMHVYAAEPAGRFVLIDGKRYAQGDRLAESLVLSEIRRDGALLDFNGKRFVVPRP